MSDKTYIIMLLTISAGCAVLVFIGFMFRLASCEKKIKRLDAKLAEHLSLDERYEVRK